MLDDLRVPTLIADFLSRGAATVAGLILFVVTTISLMRTIIVPRSLRSVIADGVTKAVTSLGWGLARLRRQYVKRDAIMAWAGPSVILLQLITWLLLYIASYGLILYGIGGQDMGDSFRQAGSSLLTLGFADVNTGDQTVIDFIAAATGPIVIALMIGFLPTIYGSYLNRETAVTDLSVATGAPAWGPEMVSRHALAGDIDGLGTSFRTWADLAARMRMSHAMYPVLIWVRSSRPFLHYLVSLLAILDAAALHVSLTKTLDRRAAFQLLMQGGQTFEVLYAVAAHRRSLRSRLPFIGRFQPTPDEQQQVERRLPGWNRKIIAVELASDQDVLHGLGADAVEALSLRERGGISLPRKDFDEAVELLRASGFPIERDLDEAWDQFTAARSRYEYAAYALCELVDATPAPWSGPRRVPTATVWPTRALDKLPAALTVLDQDTDGHDTPADASGNTSNSAAPTEQEPEAKDTP